MRYYTVLWFGFFFFKQKTAYEILVRSRGLGDVYKRQVLSAAIDLFDDPVHLLGEIDTMLARLPLDLGHDPVSYTHLTLPTSDLV